ncbi:MAG TPA: long-chain-fatty-acid--CoA ligase [Desulfobacteraceae bacterium]|nr:long-chain-fatty-acid--CoA ligase [Desulfobacteraceae bacterium]
MDEKKRIVLEPVPQNQLPFLKGKRTEFESIAEMITVRAQEVPEHNHVLFYDQTITYAETNERANRVANFLKAKGVKKGDVISLLVSNSPEVYYIMFGIQKLGAVAGSINFMLKGPEIAFLLEDSNPGMVFVSSEFMSEFMRGVELSNHKPKVIEVKTNTDHGIDISQEYLSDILEKYPSDEALVPQSAADPFLLLYSSGTTGKPKGILLKNEGQLSICRSMASIGLFGEGDVMLILLPMFHTNPICVWTYPIIYCAQTVCIRKAFSPTDFWPSITDNGVNILMGVPAMYNYVYYSIDSSTVDKSALRLKFAFSGAAPLSVELIKGFEEKFNVEIIEGYGLTECTGVSTVNPPQGKRKPGSIGVALPEQEIKIMDDDNNELPIGEKGEICIKGDAVMQEYLNNAEATEDAVRDGWLHTGDMAYMDVEGFIYIVDRKKDMINRGGENIYPREVEIALEAHPSVKDVAVIGIPDEALGEKVKAFITPSESGALTEQAVKDYLKDKLAKYKIPEHVEFVEDLPRNPTGKVLKKELKRMEQEKAG